MKNFSFQNSPSTEFAGDRFNVFFLLRHCYLPSVGEQEFFYLAVARKIEANNCFFSFFFFLLFLQSNIYAEFRIFSLNEYLFVSYENSFSFLGFLSNENFFLPFVCKSLRKSQFFRWEFIWKFVLSPLSNGAPFSRLIATVWVWWMSKSKDRRQNFQL